MKVGIAQIDSRVGDLAGNLEAATEAILALRPGAPDVVVLPELVLTGYPPRDLLLDPGFVAAALAAQDELARRLRDAPPVLLGGLQRAARRLPGHPGLHNAALLLREGRVVDARAKQLLPAYDVFHEPRWFLPGPASAPLSLAGRPVGALVCEDLWEEGYPTAPVTGLRDAGATALLSVNASPFRLGVRAQRHHHAARAGLPLVYVNAVGAQDELVFDGRSFAMDAAGRLLAELPAFEEAVDIVELEGPLLAPTRPPPPPALLWQAMVAGVRGFAAKNGLRHAVVGLSGGIDSAVVACVAAAALGPSRLTCVALPSRHTDPRSTETARVLAETLGCGFETLLLEPLHAAAEASLAPLLADGPAPGDTTLENVQARLRMALLMAVVNRRGGMLLATSNQTELALGYTTLYGDMAGALAPLGDLSKPRVQALATWIDQHICAIPAFIRTRPPTAELRPDQVDPFDYAAVGPQVGAALAAEAGAPAAPWDHHRAMVGAEHKRWQAPIVLKLTERAFGTGRLMPVTRAPGPWSLAPSGG